MSTQISELSECRNYYIEKGDSVIIMYRKTIRNCALLLIAVLISVGYLQSQDFAIVALIESKRKDNIVTLIFNFKPELESYFIINEKRAIGQINILKVYSRKHRKGKYRGLARYFLYDEKNEDLIRVGAEIGLSKKSEETKRDYAQKIQKKEIQYREQILSENDNRVMVLISRGKFVFGSNYGERDEYPEQIVHLDDFYIDKYEVSNGDYLKYVQEMKAKAPLSWKRGRYRAGEDDFPVLVTYYEAVAYARWAGKRLPTEEEWEKAARGSGLEVISENDSSTLYRKPIIYPWGNTFSPEKANCLDFWQDSSIREDMKVKYTRGLLPVHFFEGPGNSPFGVVNMAGNAKEWTSSWYHAYKGNTTTNKRYGKQVKVIRGGAWFNNRNQLRTSSREYGGIPNLYHDNIAGFRCARDPSILDRQ